MDVLSGFPDGSVQCVVTSIPYWGLRDYELEKVKWPTGWEGCLGLEPTPELFVEHIVLIFEEVRRVLKDDGTLWLNIGDTYATGGRGWGDGKHGEGKTSGQSMKWRSAPEGLKHKDKVGVPWMVAFALRSAGWYLRQDIIWHKPNPMPESCKDRCTTAHEYMFLMSKSSRYYYDQEAIKEDCSEKTNARGSKHALKTFKEQNDRKVGAQSNGVGHRVPRKGVDVKGGNQGRGDIPPVSAAKMGTRENGVKANPEYYANQLGVMEKRNKRSVWTVQSKGYSGAHFATFPEKLIEPCILAGCPEGGIVLDPFMGSGTTAVVSQKLGRKSVGIEMNPEYLALAEARLTAELGLFRE